MGKKSSNEKGFLLGLLGIIAALAIIWVINIASNGKMDTESLEKAALPDELMQLAKSSRSWRLEMADYIGNEAANFTFTDTKGVEHSLSDYEGREVLLVFWATWCPPCRAEIPHLIELRDEFSDDELAILAVSSEDSSVIEQFAGDKGINYVVGSVAGVDMSAPYNMVSAIPQAFFIGKDGEFKIITVGALSLEDMRTIIEHGA